MRTRLYRLAGTHGCTISAAVVIALALLIVVPNDVVVISGQRLVLLGFLLLLAVVLVRTATVNFSRPHAGSPSGGADLGHVVTGWDSKARANLAVSAYERYSGEDILHLTNFVINPAAYVVRATEEVDLFFGRVTRSVSREVVVQRLSVTRPGSEPGVKTGIIRPRAAPATTSPQDGADLVIDVDQRVAVNATPSPAALPPLKLLVPVIRQRKGKVIDELSITVNGNPMMAVGQTENRAITLVLVAGLFDNAYVPEGGKRTEAQQDILDRVEEYVLAWDAVTDTDVPYGKHRDALAKLDRARDGEAVDMFLSVSDYLAKNYYIFAETPAERDGRILIKVEHSERRPEDSATKRQQLRIFLGLGHKRFRLTLPTAAEPASYHFRCRAPEGCYLSGQGWDLEQLGDVARSHTGGNDSPHVQMSPTLGVDICHVYARHLGAATLPRGKRSGDHGNTLVVDLRYREIPPGLMGPVTLLSLVLAVVCLAVAWKHNDIFPQQAQQGTPAVIVGLVFGIPAIMSGWVASRFDAKALKSASPITVAEVASLLVLSGLAVGIAAFKTSVIISDAPEFQLPGLTVSVAHPIWAAVTLAALAQAAVCCIDILLRHRNYLAALNGSNALIDSGAKG